MIYLRFSLLLSPPSIWWLLSPPSIWWLLSPPSICWLLSPPSICSFKWRTQPVSANIVTYAVFSCLSRGPGIAYAVTYAFLREGAEVMAVDSNGSMLDKMPQHPGEEAEVMAAESNRPVLCKMTPHSCKGYAHGPRRGPGERTKVRDWLTHQGEVWDHAPNLRIDSRTQVRGWMHQYSGEGVEVPAPR